MHDEPTIGMRLRTLRHWRGMTLTEVANQAGLTQGFLSMAERGLRPLDRRSHIAAIARALRVSETDLTGGPHLSADPIQSAPHSYISALRVALESSGIHRDPVVERARPIDELAALMSGTIERQRRHCDYVEIGKELPSLIDELNLHVAAPNDEAAYRLALKVLVEAYVCASAMARNLGHHDLCHVAAMHADEVAIALDDPIARGKAAFSLIRPNAHNWDRIKGMAERAANTLEPHVRGDGGVDVLGMLTLNAALAAAFCRDNASADQWLQEAAELATRVPDDVDANWMGFSDTNVNIWRVTVGVENGALGGEISKRADAVQEDRLRDYAARRASYLADVGRGLARDPRRRDEAVRWLRRAESAAPQRIRNDPKVHETVSVMLQRSKTTAGGRELRGMAARMAIPH